MIEAIISLVIALITFSIGYGALRQRVMNNRAVSDDRYNFVVKEIDQIKEFNDKKMESLNQIAVTLEGMKRDIHYIKEKLEEEK